ncbi:MAG: toll/interleukin-1 receptor domain-containing protein [Pyrinomonadaceae bacterium]
MKVFISWSGERSKAVAKALSSWLSQVIQAVEPWMSSDIEKGARWSAEIAEKLEQSRIGIICLTQENLSSPWILFEAGALSKTKDAHVCTFLLDVHLADVEPPLGLFQHTTIEKDDVRRLVETINSAIAQSGERKLPDDVLERVFNQWWLVLETELNRIAREELGRAPERRSQDEVLAEILEIARRQERRIIETESQRKHQAIAEALMEASPETRRASLSTIAALLGGKFGAEQKDDGRLSKLFKLAFDVEDKPQDDSGPSKVNPADKQK